MKPFRTAEVRPQASVNGRGRDGRSLRRRGGGNRRHAGIGTLRAAMLRDPFRPRLRRLDETEMDSAAAVEHDAKAEHKKHSAPGQEKCHGHGTGFQHASQHGLTAYRVPEFARVASTGRAPCCRPGRRLRHLGRAAQSKSDRELIEPVAIDHDCDHGTVIVKSPCNFSLLRAERATHGPWRNVAHLSIDRRGGRLAT